MSVYLVSWSTLWEILGLVTSSACFVLCLEAPSQWFFGDLEAHHIYDIVQPQQVPVARVGFLHSLRSEVS